MFRGFYSVLIQLVCLLFLVLPYAYAVDQEKEAKSCIVDQKKEAKSCMVRIFISLFSKTITKSLQTFIFMFLSNSPSLYPINTNIHVTPSKCLMLIIHKMQKKQ